MIVISYPLSDVLTGVFNARITPAILKHCEFTFVEGYRLAFRDDEQNQNLLLIVQLTAKDFADNQEIISN
ncbi:hypothetical protein [Rouxiella sp. WC2420]|uniref:Uncharacterized protein n=1 Tax=Rouxiella sp. WC2420 TaxID=3234145 RepID=A0AB39VV48_9GAMM